MTPEERELGNMREVQEGILEQLTRIADSLDKIGKFGIEVQGREPRIFTGGGR